MRTLIARLFGDLLRRCGYSMRTWNELWNKYLVMQPLCGLKNWNIHKSSPPIFSNQKKNLRNRYLIKINLMCKVHLECPDIFKKAKSNDLLYLMVMNGESSEFGSCQCSWWSIHRRSSRLPECGVYSSVVVQKVW